MRSRILSVAAVSLFLFGCSEEAVVYDPADSLQAKVSGENAFSHVENIVAFGPRPAGSEELEESRKYIEQQLKELGWTAQRQTFTAKTPDGNVEFTNLRARFGASPDWDDRVRGLLCSHYDTKPYSGFEFVGANDGGSSTGLLIELARVLAEKPSVARKIELVFFDGEEAFGPNITPKDGLYGSKHYAAQMLGIKPKNRPVWGVLLDMIGDKDLKIRAGVRIPRASLRELADDKESGYKVDMDAIDEALNNMSRDLLAAAADLDFRSYVGISPNYITDDHVPLNVSAGIPTIDLIDFDYKPWHTPGDTMDQISAQSLEISGRVTMQLIERYLLQ